MTWCGRCQKQVETWRDDWVDDGWLRVFILCFKCNAVLQKWSEAVTSANG